MTLPKSSKLLQFINWRVKVTVQDGRYLVGQFMAFDKHMNIVLGDTEEFRKVSQKGSKEQKEEKRTLGFVLLRGENVIALTPETPPPPKARAAAGRGGGPGQGRAAGRGVPVTGGLSGVPVPGVGGPGAGLMAPLGRAAFAAPVQYGAVPGVPGLPPMMGRGMPGLPGRGMGRGM